MFEVTFDDFMRKCRSLDIPVELHKLTTCYANTPEFDTYYGLYMMEDSAVQIHVAPDNRTYTFYTINPTKHTKELLSNGTN